MNNELPYKTKDEFFAKYQRLAAHAACKLKMYSREHELKDIISMCYIALYGLYDKVRDSKTASSYIYKSIYLKVRTEIICGMNGYHSIHRIDNSDCKVNYDASVHKIAVDKKKYLEKTGKELYYINDDYLDSVLKPYNDAYYSCDDNRGNMAVIYSILMGLNYKKEYCKYFFLHKIGAITATDVAGKFGVSKQYIRDVFQVIKKKLREKIASKGLNRNDF